jgi:FKBP-type peptidyl-prolyl cis-trans isomerase FkpA
MKKKKRINLSRFLLSGLILLVSCNSGTRKPGTSGNYYPAKDSLINYNKKVAQTEDQEIEDFIGRYQWSMNTTQTGLRYMIIRRGNGQKAVKGKKAVINYTVRLINGDTCYTSGKDGPLEFQIGHGGVESGLEEGILLLRVGDRAKFIVPSHLAFGLLGDQAKIPQRATLVYDVDLIKIK